MKRARQLHRYAGWFGAAFLLLSTVTGLLWAYAPHLYWAPGYLEKKQAMAAPPIVDVAIEARAAAATARAAAAGAELSSLTLRADIGRLLWDARLGAAGDERVVLIDAVSGARLSPLSSALAEAAARQYVAGAPDLIRIEQVPRYQPRKGRARPAFIAQFAGDREVVIDAESGAVLEESDPTRRFHFWVMRLHQLSFLGFKKELTIIPGALLVFLIVTGYVLVPWWRRRRARPAVTGNL